MTLPARVPPRALRWAVVLGFGLVLVSFARMPELFRFIGVSHLGHWFLDLYAILAAGDAQAIGLDIYVPNRLDVIGRPHAYSHWWLLLGRWGFTRGDTFRLGFLLDAAFVVAALAAVRPRRLSEAGWFLTVLCSPAILLALDRANNDLVMFILLAPVVPCLCSARAGVRLLAVPLLVLAAVLKVYPLVAGLILLAGVDARDSRRLLFAGALLLAGALPDMVTDFFRYGKLLPEAGGLTTFGAPNLFVGLGANPSTARLIAVAAGGVLAGVFLWWRPLAGWNVAPEDRKVWLGFVLGAVLVTGCFFAGMSYSYRWVFALWMVPWLWRTVRDAAAPRRLRGLAIVTAALLGGALWGDALCCGWLESKVHTMTPERIREVADRIFYLEQPVAWVFFACLLVFLVHFAEDGVRRLFRAGPEMPPLAQ